MMKVTVISATEKPVDVIGLAAGTCYGKFDVSPKRVERCFESGHLSVFEHSHVTFRIEGISRSCMAQLTRHRHVSFCIESQRYCRIDTDSNDWYVTPPEIEHMNKLWFDAKMNDAAEAYNAALAEGIKPEDARYLLPEATKTNLVMTVNVRELFHIFDMRMAKSAQWEIQGLARALHAEASGINDQWAWLMGLYA
ncbi:MAG: FAD-dependent thymidylate synthase [Clostridia bacterium]|nr:FAD-dependent thymidylate synthase [Clostridia bacterium]